MGSSCTRCSKPAVKQKSICQHVVLFASNNHGIPRGGGKKIHAGIMFSMSGERERTLTIGEVTVGEGAGVTVVCATMTLCVVGCAAGAGAGAGAGVGTAVSSPTQYELPAIRLLQPPLMAGFMSRSSSIVMPLSVASRSHEVPGRATT